MLGRRAFLLTFLVSCALLKAALERIVGAEAYAKGVTGSEIHFDIHSEPEAACDFCSSIPQDATMLVATPPGGQVRIWREDPPWQVNPTKPGWVVRDHLNICSNCVQSGSELVANIATEGRFIPQSIPGAGGCQCSLLFLLRGDAA